MDKDDFYVEGYIIDDDGKRVSPNLKMKDMEQVTTLTDIVFRSKLNIELRMNPKLKDKI
jgi:hypothetical protein